MELFLDCIILFPFLLCLVFILFPSTGNQRLPPGPHPLALLRNILQIGTKPHRAFADLARQHGPIMSLKLGTITTVVISSPAAAKEVLQKHDHVLSGRPIPDAARACDHHIHSFIWKSASSPKWKRLKRLCSVEMFSPQKLNSTETLRRQKVDELLHFLDCCSSQSRPVYVGHVVFTTAFNIISNMLFSVNLVSYDGGETQRFKDVLWGLVKESARPNVSDFFPALRVLDLQGVRRRTKALFADFFSLLDGIMDHRISQRKAMAVAPAAGSCLNKEDVLDCLLNLKDSYELTKEEIRSFLAELIIGGVETAVVTIEWSLAELLKNPTKMTKTRTELAQTLTRNSPMRESDIPRLPYLASVIKEVFRLHSAFLIPHKAESEVDIGGFRVPKNARVLVNVWAIGQDPTLWPNPSGFEPERFLGSVEMSEFGHMPFGAGRRMCPGIAMAWRMVPLLLGSVLQAFEWRFVEGETAESLNMDDKFGITVAMAKPLVVIPVKL